MTSILLKLAAVLALLAALFFAEQYVEGLGYHRARAEDQAAANQLKAQAAATLARGSGHPVAARRGGRPAGAPHFSTRLSCDGMF